MSKSNLFLTGTIRHLTNKVAYKKVLLIDYSCLIRKYTNMNGKLPAAVQEGHLWTA